MALCSWENKSKEDKIDNKDCSSYEAEEGGIDYSHAYIERKLKRKKSVNTAV